MESGTAAPTSTTVRRWAQPATQNAASTASPKLVGIVRAGDKERSRMGMASADKYLGPADTSCPAFRSPFDTSDLNPGYIKGYLPGVRENGGQYTMPPFGYHGLLCHGRKQRAWNFRTDQSRKPRQYARTDRHL